MRGRRTTLLVVLAIVATASASLLVEHASHPSHLDPTPSTRNGDPRGLLAAFRYLGERGVDVRRLDAGFDHGAQEAGVLVISAPRARWLDERETKAALGVARRGGVLVVISPTKAHLEDVQPLLAKALGAESTMRRGTVVDERPKGRDVSERVTAWTTDPLLAGGRTFLARVRHGIRASGGTPLAGAGQTPVIVRKPLGKGLVYLLATPTLLENHRVDLADDLHLLEGLRALALASGGPLVFDEQHHLPPPAGGPGSILGRPAVLATGIQLALVCAVLLLAIGRRFGPVRPLVPDTRRSSVEYADTLAALYRRAADESALCEEVRTGLRRRLHERTGLGPTLDEAALAARLASRVSLSPEEIRAELRVFDARPPDIAACVRAAARLEARVEGRKVA